MVLRDLVRRSLLACLALVLLETFPARAASTAWIGDDRAAVRLVTATDAVSPGAPVEAALEFRFGDGWHGAWRSPGDAGLAPTFDGSASDGLVLDAIAWPAPRRLAVGDLQTFVYESGTVLPLRFARRGDGAAHLRLRLVHAVCGEVCVPYRATLDLALPAGPDRPSAEAGLIGAARALVPGPPEAAGFAVVGQAREGAPDDRRLVLRVTSERRAFVAPDLFVEGPKGAVTAPPAVALSDGGHAARIALRLPPDVAETDLRVTLVDGARSAEFTVPPMDGIGWDAWLAILATALLGGLVLNAMPCVLPVLSLKAFTLTRAAGGDRRGVRAELLATAAGIVASFLAIALVLIVLKASGASIGWGIQFQAPWFLAGMALLTVLFAASLFEWVTIGLPRPLAALGSLRGSSRLSEAFLTGAFATLLATPCSAPFVGSAVGFALTRGRVDILLVFAALGLGMALPFALLALKPGWTRLLPRPGPWMVRLRSGFGLLLLGTAAWLMTVFAAVDGIPRAIGLAGILALLLGWLALSRRGRSPDRRRSLVTAALVLALVPVTVWPSGFRITPVARMEDGPWRAFAPEAIPALVAEGKVVVVDVTASWCLTCRINDVTTLDRAEIRARLSAPDAVAMRADWTQADPAILAFLRRFGRFGIPLLAVYGPGLPRGEALPELLTPAAMRAAIVRAARESSDKAAAKSLP
ncbi:protein-disulfide reductase DsbD family protein [Methylobacterium sp. J-090]|uniref:protein-disulfide reductase DsbD family protein n=1 Tax=Methylobacterium sp. J-090 TaxID=2836666 RepID=UPI001FBAA8F6|nr:thioredoxin family protein [Methylobacterium sp. J-090]MCJ2082682.1 thioredoxin family protein [Methylobacterium sp. J-090]